MNLVITENHLKRMQASHFKLKKFKLELPGGTVYKRICLPMPGILVQPQVQEDSTCLGATASGMLLITSDPVSMFRVPSTRESHT